MHLTGAHSFCAQCTLLSAPEPTHATSAACCGHPHPNITTYTALAPTKLAIHTYPQLRHTHVSHTACTQCLYVHSTLLPLQYTQPTAPARCVHIVWERICTSPGERRTLHPLCVPRWRCTLAWILLRHKYWHVRMQQLPYPTRDWLPTISTYHSCP